MKKTMFLNRKDLDKIKEVLDQFPTVDVFELNQDSSSGIGSVTIMSFNHTVNGIDGNFTIEVSGVEEW